VRRRSRSSISCGLQGLRGGAVSGEPVEGSGRDHLFRPIGALKARLDKFNAMIPDVKEGDQIEMTYVAGKGTIVTAKGTEKGVIEGKDFADALFSVWLGPNPVQEDLKKAVLKG
jgi:hypothetical protein